MIDGLLLSALFTFSATATGLEKGAPVEFLFAGADTDRDYETLFTLDCPIDQLCRDLESAGLPCGKTTDANIGRVWPTGVQVSFSPSIDSLLESTMPEGLPLGPAIYTGGCRLPDGSPMAVTNMPLAVFALYTLNQSPFTFNGLYEQGEVYNCHHVRRKFEKGEKITFTLSWDISSAPKPLSIEFSPGNGSDVLNRLRTEAKDHELDVRVDFSPDLTVHEAKNLSEALDIIDSPHVKINDVLPGRLYYRAFLPLVKWTDRHERLIQPFELTIGQTNKLVYIDEDWSGPGLDPKFSPRSIELNDVTKYPRTTTCFIFSSGNTKLIDIYNAMKKLERSSIRTWYVFERE